MARELPNLTWIEDLLPTGFTRKAMFGGVACYLQQSLVLVMFESTGQRSYKGKKYNFEIWNGCMFPAEREHHDEILRQYPFLMNHPVLPKWLYLPLETEDFEGLAESVVREIRRRNPAFGVIPKSKKNRKEKVPARTVTAADMRRPRMFRDEPAEERLNAARKISDLRNFGPSTEKAFHNAGIRTAQQFRKLGWKKTLEKLSRKNPKACHALFAYAMIGALKNRDFGHIDETDKAEARAWTAELRKKIKK